jgi:ABC-type polysaccharide/polyol phosphate export permease
VAGGSPSLGDAWRIQRRVIGALLMREMLTRYGRRNIGFLWMFVEPMLFTLLVTALWSVIRAHVASSVPIVAFALTGYSTVLLWRNMPGRCIGAVGPNLALMYHRNVKIIDIYAARLLLEGGGATSAFVVLAALFTALGWMQLPENVSLVLLGWFMSAWFGLALALFVGALSERSELVEKIWGPLSYIFFPLSGAAFFVDALPVQAQEAILWFPMVHGVEMLRDGYFGSHFQAQYDLAYMAKACAGLSLVGLAMTRINSRTVLPA